MSSNGKCPYAVIIPGDKQHTARFNLFKTSAFSAHLRVFVSSRWLYCTLATDIIRLLLFLPRFHCELSYNFSSKRKKLEDIDHQVGKVMVC